ncbi:malectin domain-containing carbohydrate-binding protein [Halobacteria archaeon AArc-dxtr1]|nr:malectin domain-containing carbohydrate-binding protein [Halobacteria archaeon AArc-dxtr1]
MSDKANTDGAEGRVNKHRRRFLQGVGATGIAGITAGCLGDDDENGDDANGDDANGDDEPPAESDTFEITALEPGDDSVSLGESVTVTATVENTGEEDGEQDVEFFFDGDSEDVATLELESGAEDDVSFDVDTGDLDEGDYDYEVTTDDDSESATLTVDPFEDLDSIFSFGEDSITVQPGTAAISGEFDNSYPVAAESGEVSLDVPDGWEIVDDDGTSFDELGAGSSQSVEWHVEVPDDEDEFELEAEASHEVGDESHSEDHTLEVTVVGPLATPLAFNFGSEADEPTVKDGVPFTPNLPDAIQILGDYGTSTHDVDDVADTDDDDLYLSEHHGSDGGDLGYDIPLENGVYDVTFYFGETWEDNTEPDDTRVMDISINGSVVFDEWNTVAEVGYATAARETISSVQVTDGSLTILGEAVDDWVAFNGLKIEKAEVEIQHVEGGVADEPSFTLLPEEGMLEMADPEDYDEDKLSAEFYFGYDDDNLHLHGEVTDDEHHALEGGSMWEADSIQYAAGYDGTYGPEDGISHVDGETSTTRWMDGENEEGLDVIEADTSRDDDENLTTYEATIPWEAILPAAPEPGDSFRFGVIINNDDGDGREAVLNWTSPAISEDKSYEALGTFTLEDPDAEEVPTVSAPFGFNSGGNPEDPQSDVPVEIDGLEFGELYDPDDIDEVDVHWDEDDPDAGEDWFGDPGRADDGGEIEDTDYDALYQTEHWGPDLGYDIAIENGVYDVTVHNAETAFDEEETRVFDLQIQGTTVAEELDLFAEAGEDTAHTITLQSVVVNQETLSIRSTTHEDNTKFCGIEIREAGAGAGDDEDE